MSRALSQRKPASIDRTEVAVSTAAPEPAYSNAAMQELLQGIPETGRSFADSDKWLNAQPFPTEAWESSFGDGALVAGPVDAVRNGLGQARSALTEAAARTGIFRTGMDNRFPGPGADKTAYLTEQEQAQEYFSQRLEAARAYLREQGLEGTITAKLVTADIVNLAGQSPVEHGEWQLMMVPHAKGARVPKEIDPKKAPGLFDEKRLDAFVRERGAKTPGSPILRSQDNPLFLGRLNYGTAGSGMYTRVPDYAEIGGHKYNTREVEMMATASEKQVRAAIDTMYTQQSRPYSVDGVCHQGAALVGEQLGLDPNKVGAKIDSSWATNLKYGPKGKNGS